MAREGGKGRHQNGHPEKGDPKLSLALEMEGGGAAARAVVLDHDGETSSTEGYREDNDPCGCRKSSHHFPPWCTSNTLNRFTPST